jgi:hypothetical protein
VVWKVITGPFWAFIAKEQSRKKARRENACFIEWKPFLNEIMLLEMICCYQKDVTKVGNMTRPKKDLCC